MARCWVCLAVVCVGFLPSGASAGEEAKAAALAERLASRINMEKGIDPDTPLRDAIEFISETFSLPLRVDVRAFEEIGISDVENQPVRLPRMLNTRFSSMLYRLLANVNGAYLIRTDHVEIVPQGKANAEVYLDLGDHDRPMPRPVSVVIDKRSLADAVQLLADATGISIVVDVRQEEKARVPVSARFLNAGVENATRILANMAGLKVIALENVLFVTSKEAAAELEAENLKRAEGGPRYAQRVVQ